VNGDILIVEVDISTYNFIEIEKNIKHDSCKIKYDIIKTYVSYLENSYFDLKKEKLYDVMRYLKRDKRKNVQLLGEGLAKFIIKQDNEVNRVENMYDFDRSFGNYIYVAGVDEVGRGPLAGPIAAAAVILKLQYEEHSELILGMKDSKKLSVKNRDRLAEIIKGKAIDYSIAVINSSQVDERGISWCNNEVLKRAVLGLKFTPDIVLSDGYAVKNLNIDNEFIIKGDTKSASIACASIIAKVYRDNLMKEYDNIYSYYGFSKNAGYGTEEHIKAIKQYGICKIHRVSFLKNII
jgi:ribonuclease HII